MIGSTKSIELDPFGKIGAGGALHVATGFAVAGAAAALL